MTYDKEQTAFKYRDGVCVTNRDGSHISNKDFFWKHRFMIAILYEVLKSTNCRALTESTHSENRCQAARLNCCFVQGSRFNCGLVEAEFHRRYMHLPHGSNRLWTGIGMGSSSGTAPGTSHVYFTFSMEAAAAALAKGDLVLAGAALRTSD